MSEVNYNYLKLPGNYLFADIKKRVDAYLVKNPKADIIKLGIGDVTQPITPQVIKAMHKAVDDMASKETFRGYGPEQGYPFLIKAVINGEYAPLGISVEEDEIFISDGSKCDVGNIQEIFDIKCRPAICDPVYPVYLDSNVMAGRTGNMGVDGRFEGVIYLPSVKENNFCPELPAEVPGLIYLCSPNNPTGTALTKDELAKWVDYAERNKAVILYDSAYSAYIRNPELPKSIYEIPGAKKTAIEFKSFSKTAGFTGLRCAFTVVPKELKGYGPDGCKISLNSMWNRRQSTKFNGVSYIVQRGAEAVYSEEGAAETAKLTDYYMDNAAIILNGLRKAGYEVYGGENAPYIWWKLPDGVKSMDFLETLLEKCQVVGTPGVGFGPCGEGYFRLTAFGDKQATAEAVTRIIKKLA